MRDLAPEQNDGRSPVAIMLIRHGEKPTGTECGVTLDGEQSRKSLTVTGWARAGALVELFAPAAGTLRPGLFRPRALFASNRQGPGGGSDRELQTLQLLAGRLRLAVNVDHGVAEEQQLLETLSKTDGPSLVCWKHDYLPAIAAGLGDVEPAAPQQWPDDRYDLVWVFTGRHIGYKLTQVPELLLPEDRSTPIS